jgi:hypothetical protein
LEPVRTKKSTEVATLVYRDFPHPHTGFAYLAAFETNFRRIWFGYYESYMINTGANIVNALQLYRVVQRIKNPSVNQAEDSERSHSDGEEYV